MRKGRRLCYGKPLTKDQEIWAGTEFTTACWKASPMGTALKGERRALRAPQSPTELSSLCEMAVGPSAQGWDQQLISACDSCSRT